MIGRTMLHHRLTAEPYCIVLHPMVLQNRAFLPNCDPPHNTIFAVSITQIYYYSVQ